MTLVIIGPVTRDLIIINQKESQKVGGATFYQSFVFEKYYNDYLAIVNCQDKNLINDFPNKNKVHQIKKDNNHYFINEYPFKDNPNVRNQLTNFANIPILPSDLESILPENIDGFVINPLNRYDFPIKTIEYLKSFNVPLFISVQGFLRTPNTKVNENYTIKLTNFNELDNILSNVNIIFMDETEANIIGTNYHIIDEIVITNGSHGSRIITDEEIKINPVTCDNVVDTTGCGDTYMAAYVSQKLSHKSSISSANFASTIASEKIKYFGPFCSDK